MIELQDLSFAQIKAFLWSVCDEKVRVFEETLIWPLTANHAIVGDVNRAALVSSQNINY